MCRKWSREYDFILLGKGGCSDLHIPVTVKDRLVNLLLFACMQLRKTVFVIGQHVVPVTFGCNAHHKHQQQKTAQDSTYGLVLSQTKKNATWSQFRGFLQTRGKLFYGRLIPGDKF